MAGFNITVKYLSFKSKWTATTCSKSSNCLNKEQSFVKYRDNLPRLIIAKYFLEDIIELHWSIVNFFSVLDLKGWSKYAPFLSRINIL